MRKRRKKKLPLKKFGVWIPIKETWFFEVEATSQERAVALCVYGEYDKRGSMGGWPNRLGVVEVKELKNGGRKKVRKQSPRKSRRVSKVQKKKLGNRRNHRRR